jgi:flagellar biosynthesis protein FlhG
MRGQVFHLPSDQAETLRAFHRRKMAQKERQSRSTEPVRVISVTSGKGGVGKTFTVVNLAVALAELGNRVVIFDGDLGLANVDVMVGVSPVWTIEHVLLGERTLDEVVVEGPNGISIIPGGSGVGWLASLTPWQRQYLVDAVQESSLCPDYFLIDTPAGIGSEVLFLNAASNEILCVVSPEITSLTDSYALIKILSAEYGEREVNVIINGVIDRGNGIETEAQKVFHRLSSSLERFLHVRISYWGCIPAEELVRDSLESQRALVTAFPSSPAARAVVRLAERINKDARRLAVKGGLQFYFQRLLEAGAGE